MSATHNRFGPGATKLRSTRSGAGRALRSRTVVVIHLRRLTPAKPAARMNRAHPRSEFRVRLGARGRRAFAPRVVSAGGDLQHPAHCRNPVHGLIRAHEFERRDGTE